MSKRVKISFDIINKNKYTIIKKNDIYETNQRIKKEMILFKKNMFTSVH